MIFAVAPFALRHLRCAEYRDSQLMHVIFDRYSLYRTRTYHMRTSQGAGGYTAPESGKAIIFRANATFFRQMQKVNFVLIKRIERNSFRPAR